MTTRVIGDPALILTGVMKAYKHFDDREMSLTQLRVFTAVVLVTCWIGKEKGATLKEIAEQAGLTQAEVKALLPEMIVNRYIYDVVPTFGDGITYKLGAVGATFEQAVRRIIAKGTLPTDCPLTEAEEAA